MANDLFNRYIWLADTIYRAGKITYKEIVEKWENSSLNNGEELSLRTFHNHRKAIESIFDIDIECNKKGGYYYQISNSEELEQGNVRSWLLNTFTVSNLINESRNLKDRIIFEEIPSGRKYLAPIIEAMKDGKKLEVSYKSFRINAPKQYLLNPYCVKIFRQRWYLVALDNEKDEIHIYGLDRILDIKSTDTQFKMPNDFTPDTFFFNAFGITIDKNVKPEIIEIKATAYEANFLKALPLHHSQKEISKNSEYSVFRYYITPTLDFYQELLTHFSNIEILSPANVRNDFMQIVKGINDIYALER